MKNFQFRLHCVQDPVLGESIVSPAVYIIETVTAAKGMECDDRPRGHSRRRSEGMDGFSLCTVSRRGIGFPKENKLDKRSEGEGMGDLETYSPNWEEDYGINQNKNTEE